MSSILCRWIGARLVKYPVSKKHYGTQICLKDPYNNTCMEHVLCNSVSGNMSKINCSDYPVTIGNEENSICIKDQKNNKCIQKFLCELVENKPANVKCSDYTVKLENLDTHICIDNFNNTCMEHILC